MESSRGRVAAAAAVAAATTRQSTFCKRVVVAVVDLTSNLQTLTSASKGEEAMSAMRRISTMMD